MVRRRKAALLVPCAAAFFAAAEDAVVTLGAANFDETIASNERVLVEFYAPWCGHCKALEPEWSKAADTLKEEGLKTVLAKVDAIVEGDLAKKYKVEGFPTVHSFAKGKLDGDAGNGVGRTADAIVKWVRARELPLITEIPAGDASLQNWLAEVRDDQYAMVAKVARKSARAKTYTKVVEQYLGPLVENSIANLVTVKFGVIYLPKEADPKANSTLAMFRPGFELPDRMVLHFQGKWTNEKMVEFAKGALYPKVGYPKDGKALSGELYFDSTLEHLGKEGVVAVAVPRATHEDAAAQQKLVEELAELAGAATTWAFTMALRSGDEDESGDFHSVAITKGGKKYTQKVDKEPATMAEVKALLDSVKAGKAKPFLKSAPVPAEPVDEHGVTTLVGKTWDEYVMDAKRDVFVEFYAPWCGHCKELTPIWQDLAKRSKAQGWAERGVVIAKMDGTENDSGEEVDGYPKLVFYPAVKAGKKLRQKQIFSGARELEALSDFVLEQARSLEGFEGEKQTFNQVQRDMARRKKKTEL